MAINSKNDACNMALGRLGNYGTVSDIDTPTNDKERAFALWYDPCRQFVLKYLMPNFAQTRLYVAQLAETPAFGYAYFYEYPVTALKVLGVGEVEEKENNYNIERTPNGVKAISHDYDYEDGMPIRIVVDVKEISSWSIEAVFLLAEYLAAYTCLPITQDVEKANALMAALPMKMSEASGINAQENVPIRMSNSRFKAARFNHVPNFTSKK